MATNLSSESSSIDTTSFSIFYGRGNTLITSSNTVVSVILQNRPHPTSLIIDCNLTDFQCILDLSNVELSNYISPEGRIDYEFPVEINTKNFFKQQMCVFSEEYESLLNTNSPLSLKYLCREYILNIFSPPTRSKQFQMDNFKDLNLIELYYQDLLISQCYWKRIPLPISVKLYLNGVMPISTQMKLLIKSNGNPVLGSPYVIRVLPNVDIVTIGGGQGGLVSVKFGHPEPTNFEDYIILPYKGTNTNIHTYWIMITIAPNHFVFESLVIKNRYIFASNPTGKTYSPNSTLFLSRPHYVGPENVFTLVEGDHSYAWVGFRGTSYGIKSVKWSTADCGIFWRWQPDHYHLAAKKFDAFRGDECYWINYNV
ncbi:hypothetical protein LOD99_2656 [Oopsacas minuta]|uniref:Uncharacterized protein n=1 Tax=Oopsacas minuta TaxID=111878 RepID=A0AAV7K0U8_9METZ|nr:hypothetical protein LOD99_2656 [Oopsacas minuta]